MSIVIFKDGVMAADTSAWQGSIMVSDTTSKIIRTPAGYLVGCTGLISIGDAFRTWAQNGFPEGVDVPKGKSEDDFGALVISPTGEITEYDYELRKGSAKYDFIAIGYGVEYVLGLLDAGLTAEQAAKHAIKRVSYVGGHVEMLRLNGVEDADEVIIDEPEEEPEPLQAWRAARGLA